VVSFGLLHSLPVNPRDAVANLHVLADRDTMHTPASAHVLFVPEGTGIIAPETHQESLTVEDVVHRPAEE
jgi:hypothetical protein